MMVDEAINARQLLSKDAPEEPVVGTRSRVRESKETKPHKPVWTYLTNTR